MHSLALGLTLTLTLSLNHLANKLLRKISTLDGLVYLPNGSTMNYECLIRYAMDYEYLIWCATDY